MSPPRARQVRSAVTTVDRDDGYDGENEFQGDDRRYSGPSSSAGPPQPSPGAQGQHGTPVSHSRDHDGGAGMREPDTPHDKGVTYHRTRLREHEPPTRERFPSDRERSSERYQGGESNTAGGNTSEAMVGGGSGRDPEPSSHR